MANVSAFLFLGGDNTTPIPGSNPPGYLGIDLGSLPTLNPAHGIPVFPDPEPNQIVAPRASILVCDPQFTLEGGEVTVAPGALLHVSSPGLGGPVINNIPLASAMTILSTSLTDAIQAVDQDILNPSFVNSIAGTLFLTQALPPQNPTSPGVPPLSLDAINANMDKFIASAAKAYVDGYAGIGQQPQTVTVDATAQEERTALQTGKAQLAITCALVFVIALLLSFVTPHVNSRVPLALDAVLALAPATTDTKYI